jgi:hypothetical protein
MTYLKIHNSYFLSSFLLQWKIVIIFFLIYLQYIVIKNVIEFYLIKWETKFAIFAVVLFKYFFLNVREQIFETSFPSWYSFRTQYYQNRKTIPAPEFHATNIPGRRRGKFLFLFVNFIRVMG